MAGHTVTIPNTGITTAVMGTVTINGTLTLTGTSSTVVMFTFNTSNIYVTPGLTPMATIYFDTKCQLTLPADAVFRVWAGGLSGPCSNNNRIIIGIVQYAQCNGAPGDIYTFQELMDSGGTLNAVLTSPSTSCLGSPVQLTGTYAGA